MGDKGLTPVIKRSIFFSLYGNIWAGWLIIFLLDGAGKGFDKVNI